MESIYIQICYTESADLFKCYFKGTWLFVNYIIMLQTPRIQETIYSRMGFRLILNSWTKYSIIMDQIFTILIHRIWDFYCFHQHNLIYNKLEWEVVNTISFWQRMYGGWSIWLSENHWRNGVTRSTQTHKKRPHISWQFVIIIPLSPQATGGSWTPSSP